MCRRNGSMPSDFHIIIFNCAITLHGHASISFPLTTDGFSFTSPCFLPFFPFDIYYIPTPFKIIGFNIYNYHPPLQSYCTLRNSDVAIQHLPFMDGCPTKTSIKTVRISSYHGFEAGSHPGEVVPHGSCDSGTLRVDAVSLGGGVVQLV